MDTHLLNDGLSIRWMSTTGTILDIHSLGQRVNVQGFAFRPGVEGRQSVDVHDLVI